MAENNQPPEQLDSDQEDRRTSATRPAPSDQKLFDGVDKIVQRAQTREDIIALQSQQPPEVLEDLLTIARAVQILAASPSSAPSQCIPAPNLETQSLPSIELAENGLLTESEVLLIQHMRKEGLSADRLTTFLLDDGPDPYPLPLAQSLREET